MAVEAPSAYFWKVKGVMLKMKPTASHDRARVAQLLETAAQEEALIEELEKATRALWSARQARDVLEEMSPNGVHLDEGCRSAPQFRGISDHRDAGAQGEGEGG